MAKSVVDVLTEARALVAKGWCQYKNARDESGRKVRQENPKACSFCPNGAMHLSDQENGYQLAYGLMSRLAGKDLIDWNDAPGRTQEDVLKLFDAAIAKARAS